jgi:hypothetical protein
MNEALQKIKLKEESGNRLPIPIAASEAYLIGIRIAYIKQPYNTY